MREPRAIHTDGSKAQSVARGSEVAERFEDGFEASPRACKQPLDAFRRSVQSVCHLLAAESLEVAQNNDYAVLGREAVECGLNGCFPLAAFDLRGDGGTGGGLRLRYKFRCYCGCSDSIRAARARAPDAAFLQ